MHEKVTAVSCDISMDCQFFEHMICWWLWSFHHLVSGVGRPTPGRTRGAEIAPTSTFSRSPGRFPYYSAWKITWWRLFFCSWCPHPPPKGFWKHIFSVLGGFYNVFTKYHMPVNPPLFWIESMIYIDLPHKNTEIAYMVRFKQIKVLVWSAWNS